MFSSLLWPLDLTLILPFCDFPVLARYFQLLTGPSILSPIAAPVASHFLKCLPLRFLHLIVSICV